MVYLFRFLIYCSVFSWGFGNANPTWQKKVDRDGIQIFQQHKDSSYKFHHTKGVMTVAASQEAVIALMNDLEVCKKWIYGCKSAEFLPNTNPAEQWVYMIINGPLWLKDRDVVMKIEKTESVDAQWLVKITNQPELNSNKKHVRIQQTEATWLFTPTENDELQIIYEVYIDPRVSLKLGVNKYNRNVVFSTLENMRKMLKKAPYKDAGKESIN